MLVWSGIVQNDRTPLQICERGNVTMERFCREILLDHIRLFRYAVRPEFLFMDDNACPHRNAQLSNIPEREYINCMQWLAYSLDLNPIVHTWDAFGRSL